jgi:hypothetical protein
MVGVFFSILAVGALLSIVGEIVMRVRLTRRATCDKMAWWRRGGDEVTASYEEIFSDSRLLIFMRFIFWIFLACAGGLVLIMFLGKSN